ncbi:RidA family protein [Lichenihabitans sp. Uapishka_5]|nr:RidA family protein [Lichenihabitans sp. Uapishka_5]MDX7950537.1 RidA family protein [Lichenihabitans sp. Uapishka_5]
MTPTPIVTDRVSPPGGHYAQGVAAGPHVYVSGQLPVRPDGSKDPDADFDTQAALAISNMLAVLAAAGGGPEHLVKVTAYIVGIANWPRFNAVYARLMGPLRPARSVVPVPELHFGFLVEVDAVAMVPDRAAPTERPGPA